MRRDWSVPAGSAEPLVSCRRDRRRAGSRILRVPRAARVVRDASRRAAPAVRRTPAPRAAADAPERSRRRGGVGRRLHVVDPREPLVADGRGRLRGRHARLRRGRRAGRRRLHDAADGDAAAVLGPVDELPPAGRAVERASRREGDRHRRRPSPGALGARVEDAAGRLLAHATSRCVLQPLPFEPPEPPGRLRRRRSSAVRDARPLPASGRGGGRSAGRLGRDERARPRDALAERGANRLPELPLARTSVR